MAATVIVSHKVDNFSTWKKAFDEGAEMRAQANVNILGVYQDVDDANMVVIVSEVDNVDMAKAMMLDPKWEEVMKNAGALGKPSIQFLAKSN